MNKLLREERLQIMLSDEELNAVDNWRFDKRMPSRAAAIRELLRRGLAAEGFMAFEGRTKSKDFGVVDGPSLGDGAMNPADERERRQPRQPLRLRPSPPAPRPCTARSALAICGVTA